MLSNSVGGSVCLLLSAGVRFKHSKMFLRILSLFFLPLIWSCLLIRGEPGKCRDGVSKELTPEQLLRQDIFCTYDKYVRPVIHHTSNVTVIMKLSDEVNNVLEVHSWMIMFWNDTHLTWTPGDYGNVTLLHVSSKDIWLPDFALYDSGDLSQNTAFKRTRCLANSQGMVLCVPITKWPVHCRPNLRQWPFDSHECTVKIGSWTHVGEMIDITLNDGGVDLDDYQGSREWELKNVTAIKNVATYDCCPNATYPSVTYKFIIKRHASAYAATVTVPSFILTAMTLSTFWLDPKPPHRLAMCSISILCHCLYLQYLGIKLPSNGDMTPVIVLFFRNSIIICVAALVLSVIQLRLSSPLVSPDCGSESTPLWLTRLLGMALDLRIGRIILLGQVNSMNPLVKYDVAAVIENGTDVIEAQGKIHNDWIILVAVIDHLVFFMVLLTYIVLLIDLIPVD